MLLGIKSSAFRYGIAAFRGGDIYSYLIDYKEIYVVLRRIGLDKLVLIL